MYILYHMPPSQHSRRVVSLLAEAGLDYETRTIALDKGEQYGPDYLTINPNHQIPTLIDGEIKIHESNAILRYLCVKHRLTDWYPDELVARALTEQWLDWCQCRLGPGVVDVVLNSVFLGDKGDKAAIARGKERLEEVIPIMETHLGGHAFFGGERPTISDLAIFSAVSHLNFVDARPRTPNIDRWYGDMMRYEGVRKALPPALAAA